VSPDGSVVVAGRHGQETGYDLVAIDLDGEGTERTILGTDNAEGFPKFSPDGRWLAYATNESGQFEVYVSSFPQLDSKRQVSEGGGSKPLWRADGGELFYRDLGGAVLSVPIDATGALDFGSPIRLFDGPYASMTVLDYAVAPDGQRFLMFKPSPDPANRGQLILVQNWFVELKRLVPTD